VNFSFAQPAALWLLLLLPLFTVLRWVADGRATQAVTRMAAPRLLERLVSRCGWEMGLSQDEIRKRNFITQWPYQTPVALQYDTGD
jgi:hypothetical protein